MHSLEAQPLQVPQASQHPRQRSGARVTNLAGGAYDIRVAEVLCCSPAIHSAMIRVAAPYLESMRGLLR